MNTNLLIITLLGLNVISIITQVVILLIVEKHHEKDHSDVPLADPDLQLARQKANKILERTIKTADKILVNAELIGIKIIARHKLDSRYFAEDFRNRIKLMENNLVKQYSTSLEAVQSSYSAYLKTVEQTAQAHQAQNSKLMEEKIQLLATSSQKAMTDFITEVNTKVRTQIDRELITAREEITQFKKSRMKIIERHLVEILEGIMEKALSKKLNLADHSDLIFQALEQAKKDQVFK